jgi:hypothetical protein
VRIVDFGHSGGETTITRSFKALGRKKNADSEKQVPFSGNSGGEKRLVPEDLFRGTQAEEKDRK